MGSTTSSFKHEVHPIYSRSYLTHSSGSHQLSWRVFQTVPGAVFDQWMKLYSCHRHLPWMLSVSQLKDEKRVKCCQLKEVSFTLPDYFIVLENDMRERSNRRFRYTPLQILTVLKSLLHCCMYCQERAVDPGDLCPAKILLNEQGNLKVICSLSTPEDFKINQDQFAIQLKKAQYTSSRNNGLARAGMVALAVGLLEHPQQLSFWGGTESKLQNLKTLYGQEIGSVVQRMVQGKGSAKNLLERASELLALASSEETTNSISEDLGEFRVSISNWKTDY